MKTRPRLRALSLAALLLTAGCADTLSSMTQHYFYGFVTYQDDEELCVGDARSEDEDAERCFDSEDAGLPAFNEDDLIKVRYERVGDGHDQAEVISAEVVTAAERSDG